MEIKQVNNIYIGFDEDKTITEFYRSHIKFFKNHSALITCLDSARNLTKLTKWIQHLKENEIEFEIMDKAFFFKYIYLEKLFLLQKTFFHFDEMYLFKDKKPKMVPNKQFTSEIIEFNGIIPDSFLQIMEKTGADAYISDGCGLNIASRVPINS